MIWIEDFDSSLLKINKKSYKNIGIYNIGYITVKQIDDYENIHSLNPLHLMIGKVEVFDSTDQNKKVFKKHKELWDGIKMRLRP